jgi:hypothetical protein
MSETLLLLAVLAGGVGAGWFFRGRFEAMRHWPAPSLPGHVRNEVRCALEAQGVRAAVGMLVDRYHLTPREAALAVSTLERADAAVERGLTSA